MLGQGTLHQTFLPGRLHRRQQSALFQLEMGLELIGETLPQVRPGGLAHRGAFPACSRARRAITKPL
jgi:hypothetical protein